MPQPSRQLPVRPELAELERQAEELLLRSGKKELADAQFALAQSYGVTSWARLTLACHLTHALWEDDGAAVRRLVTEQPALLGEDARGVHGNWGPPMSYAANLGRTAIVELLFGLGAKDLNHAFARACLQGQLVTARKLFEYGARPRPGAVMGPAETLNAAGLELLLELGAPLSDEFGNVLAPVALLLQTYARNPEGKRACLALCTNAGVEFPDTPPLALHRGRIDLLAAQLRRERGMLTQTFSHQEIYPPALGCDHDESLALHGTPIAGGTLLHLAVDTDEMEILRWLLREGAPADGKATTDAEGFGGHTALFGCVVSQPFRTGRQRDADCARLLLAHGANPNARASLRKRLRFVEDESTHEFRDVTPLAWGERFHDQAWVNRGAMRVIAEHGGTL